MIYPPVRELAAEKIAVAVTWRVLGFSKQAFYAWCKQPVSAATSPTARPSTAHTMNTTDSASLSRCARDTSRRSP
jgi:hypothetical protein